MINLLLDKCYVSLPKSTGIVMNLLSEVEWRVCLLDVEMVSAWLDINSISSVMRTFSLMLYCSETLLVERKMVSFVAVSMYLCLAANVICGH